MTVALHTEDPATAIAMGRCLTARSLAVRDQAFRPTVRHDRECGWCDYPIAELRLAVQVFTDWAGFDDRALTTGRHATRSWADLPRDEQEARITAAQGLEPEPECLHPDWRLVWYYATGTLERPERMQPTCTDCGAPVQVGAESPAPERPYTGSPPDEPPLGTPMGGLVVEEGQPVEEEVNPWLQ